MSDESSTRRADVRHAYGDDMADRVVRSDAVELEIIVIFVIQVGVPLDE